MKLLIAVAVAVFFLACGNGGGGSSVQADARDAYDNRCLELGCSSGCTIYTTDDPDGAGTIQYCKEGNG